MYLRKISGVDLLEIAGIFRYLKHIMEHSHSGWWWWVKQCVRSVD